MALGIDENSVKPLDEELDQFDKLKTLYKHARDQSHDWRQESRIAYDFVAGKQYSDEDQALLKIQNRPPIVFNRVLPLIDAVCGLEVNNRQEVCYYPRTMGDVQADDILTNANKWARDECEGAEEESDAFRDLLTTGMGWTESRIDYDLDPDGKIIIERVDPMEMYWDSTAIKKNLGDAQIIFRVRDVSVERAEKMFPEVDVSDLHAYWADDTGSSDKPHDATEAPYYRNDQSRKVDKTADKVRLVEAQWWEQEQAWSMIDPITNARKDLSDEEYQTLLERTKIMGLPAPQCIKKMSRKYYKAFLGNVLLDIVDGPKDGGFTYKCMTGKRDRNKGMFFGLVRQVIDPQNWANKWLSQTMFIINSNAKGGIIAEADAFEDMEDAADSYAQSDSITIAASGAIQKGMIKDKPQSPFPQGLFEMMKFAISSVPDCSGLNMEILGQADRNQPGVLEHQRKQAAMTILAEMFDSLRRYRKDQGRLMLYYITNFISDGRLIRINGDENAQYIPLIHKGGFDKYDVIVDDAPDTVNVKERGWVAIQQLMPVISRMGNQITPDMWMTMLKYSPLPPSFLSEMKKALEQHEQQMKQNPPPNPLMIKAQADQTRAQADQTKAQAEMLRAQGDVMVSKAEANKQMTEAQWHGAQAQLDQQSARADVNSKQMQASQMASNIYLNYMKGEQIKHDSMLNQVATTVDAVHKLSQGLSDESPA